MKNTLLLNEPSANCNLFAAEGSYLQFILNNYLQSTIKQDMPVHPFHPNPNQVELVNQLGVVILFNDLSVSQI